MLIPLSALISPSAHSPNLNPTPTPTPPNPNQLAVFVVDTDGKAHERRVKTDDLIRSSVIVTEGLKPGEQVVTAGASTLYEGALVDARTEDVM